MALASHGRGAEGAVGKQPFDPPARIRPIVSSSMEEQRCVEAAPIQLTVSTVLAAYSEAGLALCAVSTSASGQALS